MTEVFVYGTLKKGGGNHHFLKDSDFIRHEILVDHSIYVPKGFRFPLMLKNKGGKVYGEIYRVSSKVLAKLDMLESEGHLYNRVNDVKLGYQYYLFNETNAWEINKENDIINLNIPDYFQDQESSHSLGSQVGPAGLQGSG